MSVQGNAKSNYEKYFAEKLNKFYPELKVILNEHKILPHNLELDMYIPQLNIGVEVQGNHHYSPKKYGFKRFKQTKNNDLLKRRLCKEMGIDLVILDISHARLSNLGEMALIFDMLVRKINSKTGVRKFEVICC